MFCKQDSNKYFITRGGRIMTNIAQIYAENGVFISKSNFHVGDEVTISYNGLLAQQGADSVYIHMGYGPKWKEKTYIPMKNEEGIFKAKFKILLDDVLNISFKDSADNWDNNSYMNYSFSVSKEVKSTSSKTCGTSPAKTDTKKTASKCKTAKSENTITKKSTKK
jgi:hypothetical protein